jgi:hypothetical protein
MSRMSGRLLCAWNRNWNINVNRDIHQIIAHAAVRSVVDIFGGKAVAPRSLRSVSRFRRFARFLAEQRHTMLLLSLEMKFRR